MSFEGRFISAVFGGVFDGVQFFEVAYAVFCVPVAVCWCFSMCSGVGLGRSSMHWCDLP